MYVCVYIVDRENCKTTNRLCGRREKVENERSKKHFYPFMALTEKERETLDLHIDKYIQQKHGGKTLFLSCEFN